MTSGDLGQMVVKIVGDNSQFNQTLDSSEKRFNDTAQKLGAIGKGLSMFVSLPLLGIGAAALKSTANMESLTASFTTMLGSAKAAGTLMDDLKKMGAKTPFEVTDLAQASKTLLQFGVDSKKIIPTLQMIGDAAGGNSQKMGSMALVFGQISSLGRLMGQDLLQLINNGFNPLMEISKKTGESMAVLKDRMAKGGISAEEVAEAFKMATSEGGRFYKGMDTASKTLEGLVSTLKDDVGALGRDLVEDFLPTIKNMVKGLSGLAQSFTNMDDFTKTLTLSTAGLLIVAGPALTLFSALAPVVMGVAMGFNGLTIATNASKVATIANTVAMQVAAIAQAAWATVTGTATIATVGFNAALAANPIGAIVIGLLAAGAAAAGLIKVFRDASKERQQQEKNAAATAGLENELRAERLEQFKKQAAEENAEAIKANQKERERIIAVATARKEAAFQYEQSLKRNKTLTELGLQTEAEGRQNVASINKQYAESLIDIGYDLTSLGKANESIGDKALNASLNVVKAYEANELAAQKTAQAAAESEEAIKKAHQAELDLLEEQFWLQQQSLDAVANANQDKAASDAAYHMKWKQMKIDEYLKEKETQKKKKEEYKLAAEQTIQVVQQMLSTIAQLNAMSVAAEVAKINQKYDELTGAEKTYQAYLDNQEKARYNSMTAEQKKEYNLQKEATKSRVQAEKDRAMAVYKVELESFKLQRKIALAQIAINTAMAVAKVWGQTGLGGLIAQAAPIAMGLLQAALVMKQEPPPKPALGSGGIVMPKVGGVDATLAERGSPEVVFPLEELNRFLNDENLGNSSEGSSENMMINLVVNVDSLPILKKIFAATKNRTVLISQGAVV